MGNKLNRVAGVRGNRIVNLLALVSRIGLWLSCGTLGCNVLNVMYFIHIVFGMYSWLKSFQIVMSFQPGRALSLAYFLDFFCASYKKNHAFYMVQTNYLWVNDKWNYNIWNRKIILISMLPSCSVILPNPPHNIIICFIPLKFSLAIKIYTKKNFSNFNKVNELT